MKKISVLVKKVLMSTLTAGIIAFGFASCTDEIDNPNDNQDIPEGADTALLEAYGLTFQNFDNADDVVILNADTTQLSISKAYADKMGIKTFVNHPMGIWHKVEGLPYIRKATSEQLVGDRYIVDVVPATVAEIVGNKKLNLMTDIYVNKDAGAVKTRAAGDNIPEYAAKYIDDNETIHPAYVHMTDPYGYDTEYSTEEDKPSAAQTRAAEKGEFMYMTADEIADGNTRWGCHNRIIAFEDEVEKKFNLAVGKGSKDSVYAAFRGKIDFGINYFLTIDGGVKWKWCFPSPYLEKFEAGLDGNFGFEAGVSLGFTKEWELDKDKFRKELFKFRGYTFTFWIGPVPVAIVTDPHLDVQLDAKVSGTLETTLKYEYANTFKAGFGWADGRGFYPLTDFNEEANDLDFIPPHIELHAQAGIGLYLVCDLKIYGLAGPKLGVGPRLGAELDGNFSPAQEDISAKGKIGLTINAVIGAKLEVLGYELADKQLVFPLLPGTDTEWILWKFNWNLKDALKDYELHESPKAKEKKQKEEGYKALLKKIYTDSLSLTGYERVVNTLMDLRGYNRQQAEDDIYRRVKQEVPNLETRTDTTEMIRDVFYAVDNYYEKQLKAEHRAKLNKSNWEDLVKTLMTNQTFQAFRLDYQGMRKPIDMDLIYQTFVKKNGCQPQNTTDHLKILANYMLMWPKIYYENTGWFRDMYPMSIVNSMIDLGKKHASDPNDRSLVELAAYRALMMAHLANFTADSPSYKWENAYKRELAILLADRYDLGLHDTRVKFNL